MITYNIFKKKYCSLDGNAINIDGDLYPIITAEETNDLKSRIKLVVVLSITSTPLAFYILYMALKDTGFNDFTFAESAVLIFLALILFYSGWKIKKLYRDTINCRSFWSINDKDVYIEKEDDPNTETSLREIIRQLERDTYVERRLKKKKLTVFVMVALTFSIYILANSDYIKEDILTDIFSPIALVCIFIFLFIDCLDECMWWRK